MQYLSNILGIKDPIHKQKIALKAMDVVLFGPPKGGYYLLVNIILYNTCILDKRNEFYFMTYRYWTQPQRFSINHVIIWSTYWMLVCISTKEKLTETSSQNDEGHGKLT